MREGRARQYREYCKRGRQSSAPAAPRPGGLRPKSSVAALLALPIFAIWAAASASPPTILATTQHAFDYEIGSNQIHGFHRVRRPKSKLTQSMPGITARYIAEQAIKLLLYYVVTLTCLAFKRGSVEHLNVTAAVAYQSRALQIPGGLGHTFAAHAEHVRDQFLGHGEFVG